MGEILSARRPDRPWEPPASCTTGTGSLAGDKAAGECIQHTPPYSVELKKEYTSFFTPPLGRRGPLQLELYLTFCCKKRKEESCAF